MKSAPMIAIESQKEVTIRPRPLEKSKMDGERRDIELRKKSNELEAVFLTQLIKSMEKTIPKGMGGGNNTLSTMMFSTVLGDAMSQGGGIGLSKMIFASLKKMDGIPDLNGARDNGFIQSLDALQNISTLEDSE